MTRNKWTALGLSVLALLVVSAFVVSGAQGNNPEPEVTCLANDSLPHVACIGHGTNVAIHREHDGEKSETHTYTAGAATLTCKTTSFAVEEDANGTNPTPEAEPTYENCQANPGHLQVHVATNGCHFQFHPDHTSGETKEENEYTGTTSIKCPEGKSIAITVTNNTFTEPTNEAGAAKCTIHISEQTGIGPIYFRTHTGVSPTDVTVEANTAKAVAKFTGGFFNCGVFGETANTFYTGNTTVRATATQYVFVDTEID